MLSRMVRASVHTADVECRAATARDQYNAPLNVSNTPRYSLSETSNGDSIKLLSRTKLQL